MKIKSLVLSVVALMSIVTCGSLLSSCGNKNTNQQATVNPDDPNATKYEVTLDPNGGHFSNGRTEPLTIKVTENGKINFEKFNVEMEGNDLLGWYYEDLVTPFPMARKITGELTLIAKWNTSEEKETFDLGLTIEEKSLQLTYESSVYQFSYTGTIYGGYTSRPAMYTIYEDKLKEGIEKDDGTVKKVIYRAESNYTESTGGEVYALFYNDASFELFYKYMYQGVWNDYSMVYGTFDLKGYDAPFERPDETAYVQGAGLHQDWQNDFNKKDDEPTETIEDVKGVLITSIVSNTTEAMKLEIYDNGLCESYFNYNNLGTFYATGQKTTWSVEEGKVVLKDCEVVEGASEGKTIYKLQDTTYEIDHSAVIASMREDTIVYTASSIDSESMRVTFRKNHTYDVEYNMNGEWVYTMTSGTYNFEEGQLKIDAGLIEVENAKEGNVYFKRSGATYEVNTQELLTAQL